MNAIRVEGRVDEAHRLSADVPGSIPPGPVILWIAAADEDDAGRAWATGLSRQWADELGDERQDIYTLADGKPLDEPR